VPFSYNVNRAKSPSRKYRWGSVVDSRQLSMSAALGVNTCARY
jgi:hypothetical protein